MAPEIWNQNSGPPGQNFDSKFPRLKCVCVFSPGSDPSKVGPKPKSAQNVAVVYTAATFRADFGFGQPMYVAAINLSMGQRGNPRFIFLCIFSGQRAT